MNIQQLRAQIAALQDATMDKNKNFRSAYDEGKFDALSAVDSLLDFLQEEPVSDDLEEAASAYAREEYDIKNPSSLPQMCIGCYAPLMYAFKVGANWQKENMMKDAIEREVKIDAGGYPYIDCDIEFYDYDKDIPLAKEGDKVKVIIVKDET